MEIQRVKCKVCLNEDKEYCKIKKTKVKANKTRMCQDFAQDVSKIRVSSKPKARYTPFHLRSSGEYKKYLKAEEKKQKEKQIINNVEMLKSPDCLSQFRSTAQ